MILEKKVFLSTIKAIKDTKELNRKIEKSLELLVEGWPFLKNTYAIEDSLVNLVESLYKNDFFSYWVYELDFGKNYTQNSVSIYDKKIDISTENKLYEFLESMQYMDEKYKEK